ncbi:MAG: murein hydrolase activator EnvC family protein [Acidimicrobiales bacterium]
MRRALVAIAAVLAMVSLLASPASAADPTKVRQAAQTKANQAAARLSAAESTLAKAQLAVSETEARVADAERRIAGLDATVKSVAVTTYMRGGAGPAALFDGDLARSARGMAMAKYVTYGNTDALDEWRAARGDLDAQKAALASGLDAQRKAAAEMKDKKLAAYKELDRLAAAEKAYKAKLAAQAAQASQRQSAARASRRAPVGQVTGVIASGSWVCPVQGPHSFTNDWGAPRSGGRGHQGTDMMARRGTPLVAPVAGTVTHRTVSLGGRSYFLKGVDGTTYFGTHLSGYGQGGKVAAGTVIAYVGDDGNARGTPHLHFEIHPGGGGAVNPYPTLRKYC